MMTAYGYPVGAHWAARVTVPPDDDDVLTVDELKERARIGVGDAESDALMQSYIAAAREQVQNDTGCALTTQTIAVGFDEISTWPIDLPWPPCQSVTSIAYSDDAGDSHDLDPAVVIQQLDILSMPARLIWMPDAFAGLPGAGAVQPLTLLVVVGWTKATLPPSLKFAVGLLASHYLTTGRDRAVVGTIASDMPAGYDDAIAPWRLVKVI